MNNVRNIGLILLFNLLIIRTYGQNNVIISDVNNTTPDVSSVLEIRSTSKGLLIPRVSLSSMTDGSTILLPATSLLVYNTNSAITNGAGVGYYYNTGTSAVPNWQKLLAGNTINEWKLLGNSNTIASTNFLGTTDAVDLVFRTNNVEKVRIMSGGNVGIGTNSPGDKLDVFPTGGKNVLIGGGTSTGSELKLTNSGTSHFSLYNSGNNNLTFANTSSNFQTNTSGTPLMSLTSGGNLGIGATSPSERLHVNGNAQIDGALRGTVRYYAEAGSINATNGNNKTTDGWYWNGATGGYSISDLAFITVTDGTYLVTVIIKADDNNTSDRVHCGLRRSDTGFIYDWVSYTRNDDRWTSFSVLITVNGGTSFQAAMNADDDFYLDYSSVVAIRLN